MPYEEKFNDGVFFNDESTIPIIPDVDYDTPIETNEMTDVGDSFREFPELIQKSIYQKMKTLNIIITMILTIVSFITGILLSDQVKELLK